MKCRLVKCLTLKILSENLRQIIVAGVALVLFANYAFAFASESTQCSAEFISRLEKKQESLSNMKQDIRQLKADLSKKLLERRKALQQRKDGVKRYPISNVTMADIIPHSSQIILNSVPLRGPLSPETSLETVKEEIKKNSE